MLLAAPLSHCLAASTCARAHTLFYVVLALKPPTKKKTKGDDRAAWAAHDATALVAAYKGPPLPCLIDTGSADTFLEVQLKPERFEAAAKAAGFDATVRMQVCFVLLPLLLGGRAFPLNTHTHTKQKQQNNNTNQTKKDGYDHSYYFIATFIDEHVAFHAAALKKAAPRAA